MLTEHGSNLRSVRCSELRERRKTGEKINKTSPELTAGDPTAVASGGEGALLQTLELFCFTTKAPGTSFPHCPEGGCWEGLWAGGTPLVTPGRPGPAGGGGTGRPVSAEGPRASHCGSVITGSPRPASGQHSLTGAAAAFGILKLPKPGPKHQTQKRVQIRNFPGRPVGTARPEGGRHSAPRPAPRPDVRAAHLSGTVIGPNRRGHVGFRCRILPSLLSRNLY